MTSWGEAPLTEKGLALSTKLAMLDQVANRINVHIRLLREHLANNKAAVEGYVIWRHAYELPENLNPYDLLVDIDSFLFESKLVYEIVGEFLKEFHSNILDQQIEQHEIKAMLDAEGIDTGWTVELAENRNLFFHEATPWIAFEIHSTGPHEFEPHLLILKRSTVDFRDPADYVHFDRLREIFDGFRSSMQAIHRWLEDKIKEFEDTESA